MRAKVIESYLTTAEVADRLGRCQETVRRLAREGKLRHFRSTNRAGLRFSEEHLAEYMASLERKPMTPRQRGGR